MVEEEQKNAKMPKKKQKKWNKWLKMNKKNAQEETKKVKNILNTFRLQIQQYVNRSYQVNTVVSLGSVRAVIKCRGSKNSTFIIICSFLATFVKKLSNKNTLFLV